MTTHEAVSLSGRSVQITVPSATLFTDCGMLMLYLNALINVFYPEIRNWPEWMWLKNNIRGNGLVNTGAQRGGYGVTLFDVFYTVISPMQLKL